MYECDYINHIHVISRMPYDRIREILGKFNIHSNFRKKNSCVVIDLFPNQQN